MAGFDEIRRTAADGFEGSIAGLALSDVIQLEVQSRFSGCIAVQNGQARGLIFFRDSEIVHAELGGKTGEDAFCDILEWPNGRFSLQPNVSTTRSHLLLFANKTHYLSVLVGGDSQIGAVVAEVRRTLARDR